MTRKEIGSALRGALYFVALIGLFWLMLAIAHAGDLF
jgi:hypothetical protein